MSSRDHASTNSRGLSFDFLMKNKLFTNAFINNVFHRLRKCFDAPLKMNVTGSFVDFELEAHAFFCVGKHNKIFLLSRLDLKKKDRKIHPISFMQDAFIRRLHFGYLTAEDIVLLRDHFDFVDTFNTIEVFLPRTRKSLMICENEHQADKFEFIGAKGMFLGASDEEESAYVPIYFNGLKMKTFGIEEIEAVIDCFYKNIRSPHMYL